MTLASSIVTDATTVFLDTDDFAETITYHPHRYYGDAARSDRSIVANVVRQSIVIMEGVTESVSPVWEVTVANSTTTGINSDELDLGGDAFTLSPRDGKTAERRSIVRLISQDAGMLVLEVR